MKMMPSGLARIGPRVHIEIHLEMEYCRGKQHRRGADCK